MTSTGANVNRVAWGALLMLSLPFGCGGHVSQSLGQGRTAAPNDAGTLGAASGAASGLGSAAVGASSVAGSGSNVIVSVEEAGGTTAMSQPTSAVADAGSAVADAGSAVADAGSAVADAGSAVADAGSAVADAALSEPISDADLKQAGLAGAGCHSVSRDLSCIGLPTPNVCAFFSDGRACKADADCDWLIIPDCCCTAPRYILDAERVNLGAACSSNGCYHRFVFPG